MEANHGVFNKVDEKNFRIFKNEYSTKTLKMFYMNKPIEFCKKTTDLVDLKACKGELKHCLKRLKEEYAKFFSTKNIQRVLILN